MFVNLIVLFKEGKSITQVTILHKLLNKFLGYAESETYITKNPLKGLELPKPNKDEIDNNDKVVETFTQNEIKKIIDTAGHTKIRYLITFALLTGAREGKILALDKPDIKDDIIKINKTLKKLKIFDEAKGTKYHYALKVTKPKTKNSTRN